MYSIAFLCGKKILRQYFFLNHYSQNTFLLGKKFKEYQAFKGTDGCSDS